MKKVLSILVLALVAVQFAFAGDVITQDTKQLPLTDAILSTSISRNRTFHTSRLKVKYCRLKNMKCC